MIPQCQGDLGDTEDHSIDLDSCFSVLSDSLNSKIRWKVDYILGKLQCYSLNFFFYSTKFFFALCTDWLLGVWHPVKNDITTPYKVGAGLVPYNSRYCKVTDLVEDNQTTSNGVSQTPHRHPDAFPRKGSAALWSSVTYQKACNFPPTHPLYWSVSRVGSSSGGSCRCPPGNYSPVYVLCVISILACWEIFPWFCKM